MARGVLRRAKTSWMERMPDMGVVLNDLKVSEMSSGMVITIPINIIWMKMRIKLANKNDQAAFPPNNSMFRVPPAGACSSFSAGIYADY